jgi:cell division septal protein FtsQ
VSLRRKTKISEKLPSEFETKLTEFQRFAEWLRRRNNYSLSQIGNADETAVLFQRASHFYLNFCRRNKWQWEP